jgi:predicted AAA+ superfamily ATPase
MFPRILNPPSDKSFFLFGPRGTGKTSWVQRSLPDALYLDLLESGVYFELLAAPQRLEARIPPEHHGWIIIDEVQRVPELLNEVHRLIERRRLKFALTGSSARKLRRKGVNLLAGRALTLGMHPLTVMELGKAFDLERSLRFGHLPAAYVESDPAAFLKSYVQTYLREEVQQEGLTRNLGSFGRFLEAASFSQAAVLNMTAVARECAVERKIAEDYFAILEDLLLAVRLPVFTKRAKRRMTVHPKFFFFDVGVYRALRPRGPLDSAEEIEGSALETLFFQEVRALNSCLDLGYDLYFWRAASGHEVDLVLYGERGLLGFEIKRSSRVAASDLRPLRAFLDDYPKGVVWLAHGGKQTSYEGRIRVLPYESLLQTLPSLLEKPPSA